MRRFRISVFIIFAVLFAALLFSGCARKPKEPSKMPQVRPPDISKAVEIPQAPYLVIPNELVVMLKEGKSVDAFSKSIKGSEIKIVGHIPQFRIVQVEVPSDKREALKKELQENPLVEVVVYQAVFRNNIQFNDPVFNNEDPLDDWGLKAINVQAAWEITQGSPDVAVAVVDAGVLFGHEELKDKIVSSSSVFTKDGSHVGNADDLLHGTHVAITGVGSGNNNAGTSGVAPGCSLMPVQVGFSVSDVFAGIAFAVDNKARVVNLSMGPTFSESVVERYQDPSQRSGTLSYFSGEMARDKEFVDEVFAACEALGAVVIVAAGNNNIPADFNVWAYNPFTLAVGAVGLNKEGKIAPADFSDFGYTVRVSAPGVDIYSGSAEPGGKSYVRLNGTSMAAPHVSGLAGLIVSVNPKLTPLEIRQVIIASAIPEGSQEGKLKWFKKEMSGREQIDRWRRSFLLLLGKDEELLLHDIAQVFLLSRIPLKYNTVWDPAEDKAVGDFIDVQAALRMAKDGSFREKFAVFSDEDARKAEQLKPEELLKVYDMLRFRNRYAGSKEVSGFELKFTKELDRLAVNRAQDPGKDYTEWFEHIAPGLYRHFAKFGGEDYSQGIVELHQSDAGLVIKNLRRKEDKFYATAGKDAAGIKNAPDQFYTVAGGNEPNRTGRLVINYTGPSGKAEAQDFYTYPEGAKPEQINILYEAKTGAALEMITGSYDIKILSYPAIWIRKVAIEDGKTTELQAGGYGKILIAGNDAAGKPIKKSFFMYTPENKKENLASGTTNVPLDVLEGNYFVHVALDAEMTYEDVRIRRGETTKIDLPAWGQLNIAAKDFEGQPLRVTYWLYEKGSWDKKIGAAGYTNGPLSFPPGEYNVYVNSNPDIKYENVAIRPGEITELRLPEYGAILVRGVDAQGNPLFAKGFYLYKPKGGDIISSGTVNVRLNLPAGIYDLRVNLSPDISYEAVKIEPGRVVEIELPQWGQLTVNVKDAAGKSVSRMVRVYRSRGDDNAVTTFPDKSKSLPPGSYAIMVDPSLPYDDLWLDKPAKVEPGKTTEIEVTIKERK